jgi:hypothetical protein
VFLLEAVVESLGHLLHIERRAHPPRNAHDAQIRFLVQREDKLLQLLGECFA